MHHVFSAGEQCIKYFKQHGYTIKTSRDADMNLTISAGEANVVYPKNDASNLGEDVFIDATDNLSDMLRIGKYSNNYASRAAEIEAEQNGAL